MMNALNAISENQSLTVVPPWANVWVLRAIALSFALHFFIVYVPAVAAVFHVAPLTLGEVGRARGQLLAALVSSMLAHWNAEWWRQDRMQTGLLPSLPARSDVIAANAAAVRARSGRPCSGGPCPSLPSMKL